MILGLGNDITDIRRIERSLENFGERFEKRVFTPAERAMARSREGAGARTVAATYAKRFAAKEACAKALGTGFSCGVFWHDMEVVNLPGGQPALKLSGGALAQLSRLLPPGASPRIHLALTDEYPLAQAHVIIEAIHDR